MGPRFGHMNPSAGEHNLKPFTLGQKASIILELLVLLRQVGNQRKKLLITRDIRHMPAGPETEPSVTATTLPGLGRQI